MDLTLTLAVMAGVTALIGWCGWRASRPWDPRKGPRLVPYGMIMVSCAGVLLFTVAHLLNLAGVPTGR